MYAIEIGDGHLGASVKCELGQMGSGQVDEAQVLDDDGVDASVIEIRQVLQGGFQFVVGDESVDGDVDLAVMQVEKVGDLPDLLQVEVRRGLPGAELFSAKIDGIGPGGNGGEERVPAACGSEEFG